MKKLLVFCLLLVGIAAKAQGVSPMNKASVIVVQTPDSANTALKKLAQLFVERGYVVEKLDKEFHTLLLAPKVIVHQYSPVLTIRVNASGGAQATARLSGEYRAVVMGAVLAEQVAYSGHDKSCIGVCFQELQKTALAYPSGKVSYAKR